ncbi:ATP-binding protein [Cohaesibacter gelatinilyticus]|uniref:histidine kinase n=1 Tax=Cohaesibacter gelatinilyticus TaxID=372072 RepID=A0A285PFL2_9HYPH|nr:HAMP domain-containing sensor histidine kinase [Cohaesibacter gelatinilyticus]SNZ20037.1 Signal transduction histidine kinase [Cohaesibacter gelatinilyticus]
MSENANNTVSAHPIESEGANGLTNGEVKSLPLQPDPEDLKVKGFSLSSKLLLLTILFVMLSEVLIFVPSISKFRVDWLSRKLELAEVAALAYTQASPDMMNEMFEETLLDRLKVQTLALRKEGQRQLLAMIDMPGVIRRDDDIGAMTPVQSIFAAFDTLMWGDGRTIRVMGESSYTKGVIELVFDETPLRQAMFQFAINILVLSLVISVITATLVYLSLRGLLIRPILRMSRSMVRFSHNPDDVTAVIKPSGRQDEIGMTEQQLARMEMALARTLSKQKRLADLGLAVSKINHDLRNILASAQLFSDRLSMLEDPTVQRVVPKIMGALDRAVDYSRAVMSYGKAQEEPPEKRLLNLHKVADEVADFLDLSGKSEIAFSNAVPENLEVYADPGQLFRIMLNLCRNSVQVMKNEDADSESVISRLEIFAEETGDKTDIVISDTGPGVPEQAKASLFKAFQGSVRKGGTGLGLAISAELVQAHGGSIALLERSPGAHFQICLPSPDQAS